MQGQMLLQKITLTDFGVYKGRNVFDLSTKSDRPIMLYGGQNGAGKTTLFESVSLCLYGRNAMEPRMTMKQYHNKMLRSFHRYSGTRANAEEASIALEFQYAQEGSVTQYRITRIWNNNNGRIEEDLHVGKRNVKEKKYADLDSIERSQWQTFVDQILPKGITKLFFFDGEQIQKIAESGGEDRHIKSSFDALLGMDLVHQLHDDIGLYMLRNSDGESKKILAEIDHHATQRKESEVRIEELHEHQTEKQAEINTLKTKIAKLEKKFTDLGGQYATRRQHLMAEKSVTNLSLQKTEKDMRDLCGGMLPFCLVPKQLNEVRDELVLDIQRMKGNFEGDILKKAMSQISRDFESSLGEYDKQERKNILAKFTKAMKNRIKSVSGGRSQTTFNFSLEDMASMQDLIQDIKKMGQRNIERITRDYDHLIESLNKTNSALEMAPQQDEIGPLFSDINRLNKEMGILEHELDGLRDLEAQEKSMIVMSNAKIRQNLARKRLDKRRTAGIEMAPKVQEVLEEYDKHLRLEKVALLESSILECMRKLFHKENLISNLSIDPDNFEITLYDSDGDEMTRGMMSQGELQIYATAIVWGLARTSGRPLPFVIDTPLARLDMEHRENLVRNFYPDASHQTIIFSTNSEIVGPYYDLLKPHMSRAVLLKYEPRRGRTVGREGYFTDQKKGGVKAEVR